MCADAEAVTSRIASTARDWWWCSLLSSTWLAAAVSIVVLMLTTLADVLFRLGQPALGICGGDAGLVEARKITAGSNGNTVSLGYVGRPHKVRTALLEMAFREGLVPVVAPLALGEHGEYLNINADDLAAALAMALKADRLLYLTESGGVWDAERRLLPVVQRSEIRNLIKKGVVRDGMIPKLLSCARTLRHQVGEIDIVPAADPNVLIRTVANGIRIGTRVVKSA